MTETRKTRPTVGAVGRAMESGTNHHESPVSTKNHTTPAAENQQFRVADLLLPGAENAIPRRDLMTLTGFSDRELRRQIEAERRRGIPILSDNVNGYYLPADDTERKRFVNSMLHRAMEIASVAAAVEQAEV